VAVECELLPLSHPQMFEHRQFMIYNGLLHCFKKGKTEFSDLIELLNNSIDNQNRNSAVNHDIRYYLKVGKASCEFRDNNNKSKMIEIGPSNEIQKIINELAKQLFSHWIDGCFPLNANFIKEDYICYICALLMTEPSYFVGCARRHHFCFECCQEWFKNHKICPICRMDTTSIEKDLEFQQLIVENVPMTLLKQSQQQLENISQYRHVQYLHEIARE